MEQSEMRMMTQIVSRRVMTRVRELGRLGVDRAEKEGKKKNEEERRRNRRTEERTNRRKEERKKR